MARPIRSFWLFLAGLLGLQWGTALASTEAVLCSEIQGESQRPGAEGCIDVLAWSWGASSSRPPSGGSGSPTSLQDLNFTKRVDRSSEDFFRLVATQKSIGGIVEFREYRECPPGCTSTEPYFTIRFRSAVPRSFSTGGSVGQDAPLVNVSLDYDEISYCYRPVEKGSLGPPQCFAFDRVGNTSIPPF